MKLTNLSEARYVSPPKHAIDAFETYRQYFNEYEDPKGMIGVTKDITLVDHDYSETEGADFASIYVWVNATNSEEEARFKVKEFVEHASLPYTDIFIDGPYEHQYHVTVSYKEDKS